MMHLKKFFLLSIIAMMILLLAACTPAKPTQDPNAVYTAAAATVSAQLTQQGPVATKAVPTKIPTVTIAPAKPVIPATQAPVATQPAQTTPVPEQPKAAEKYEIVGQTPADNAELPGGLPFKVTWTIKNIGTTTWTKDFIVIHFVGERLGNANLPNSYTFTNEVKPGETYNVVVDMVAPTSAGTYMSWWKLKNKDGQNFGDVTLNIKIGAAAGPTATVTSVAVTETAQPAVTVTLTAKP